MFSSAVRTVVVHPKHLGEGKQTVYWEAEVPTISRQSAHQGYKDVSRTHRPHLRHHPNSPPFLLEALVWPDGLCQ